MTGHLLLVTHHTRRDNAPMTYQHSELPPEPFGRKLTRAREDIAKMSMEVLADRISLWHACTPATISRLERRPELMPAANPIIMVLAVLGCGFDPSAFGLSLDDLPKGWDRSQVVASMQRELSLPCNPTFDPEAMTRSLDARTYITPGACMCGRVSGHVLVATGPLTQHGAN